MVQKIIKVGNSLGITLPKDFVRQSGLSAGQTVVTNIDIDTGTLQIQTKTNTVDELLKTSLSPQFVKRVDGFIKRHKPTLEKLAKL